MMITDKTSIKNESQPSCLGAVIPRFVLDNFFDLNIFKVFEDNTKIVFNVPMSVMLIDTTINKELMNTLFKCVTVEQKQPDFSMQIVTCHKNQA